KMRKKQKGEPFPARPSQGRGLRVFAQDLLRRDLLRRAFAAGGALVHDSGTAWRTGSPAKFQNTTSSSPGRQEKKARRSLTMVGKPTRPEAPCRTDTPSPSSSAYAWRRSFSTAASSSWIW